jgi:hypothetical protein
MQVTALGTVDPSYSPPNAVRGDSPLRVPGPPQLVLGDVMLIVHADEETLELVAKDGEMD